MIWELGQDVVPTSNPSSLLSAIGEQLKQSEMGDNDDEEEKEAQESKAEGQ